MKQQEAPGGPRKPQARRTQEAPGGTRKLQEAPESSKEPGRRPEKAPRKPQELTDGSLMPNHRACA